MDTMKDQIKVYNETGKLTTHPYVICTVTGAKTTMFGTNLANRIKQFGSLEKLLKEFKCRAARDIGKPVKAVRIKKLRAKRVIEKNEDQRYDIPVYKNEPHTIIDLVENAEACRELTKTECWRPDIYLNNSRTCDRCPIHRNCASKLKRLIRSVIWA